ncbi:MFS transporter [Galactobacter caseinivorans]|uniref:MFS transporter n=1 Tax=Galactobacter caseinivorans TaxID=2676123 RepID=UPI001F38CC76|nr:MFS transporter [Galactobacter caseinivorans]
MNQPQPPVPAPSAAPLSAKRRWAALSVLVLAILLLAIDGTVLYLAVPALTEALNPSATQILWIGDIYSLALAGLLVVMGTLADRIGRKRLLLIGSGLFGAASLVAAFATSAEMLMAARLLLGVAGATLMPSTLSLIRNIFPDPRERTRAIAIWSAAAGGGAALGPLVGGVLLQHFWWGSVFLINVPVVIILIVAGLFLLPESKDPHPGRFDLPSAVLALASIVPLVYAVKHTVQSGVDVLGVACLLVGLGLGWLFVRRQHRLAAPMIDVDLFRNPAFSGAVISQFIAVFALTGLLFFFSQYLQLARGFSPLQAGLAELPATLASIAVVILVGWFLGRLGAGRTIAVGLLLTALGLIAVAVAEGSESYLWLGLSLVPIGLGVGLAQTVTVDAVVTAVPQSKAGAASAISETAYELGVALGIAILGSLMTTLYRFNLPADLSGEHGGAVRESLASALAVLDPGSPASSAAQHAFTSGMQVTALVAAAVTLLGAVIAWRTIPSVKLVGKRPTADH